MDYKNTIQLPHTDFSMRANLPKTEPEILKFWDEMKIYNKLHKSRKGREKYVLHDGPPYANGHTHIGTALNKILKDIVIKYKAMKGFDTPCILGWDCHGMPIEYEVVKSLGKKNFSRAEIMRSCRNYAKKFVDIQKEEFKRMGIFGDWSHPYLTMDKNYESKIVENFGKMVDKGYIYRALRPIYWCFYCQTALSEHEVEYRDSKSPSIYVKFRVKDSFPGIKETVNFIIWTTTPWTLPANVGIALNPNYEYSFVLANKEVYIIAKDLVKNIMSDIGFNSYKVIKNVSGKKLENLHCSNPLVKRDSLVILADFVTLEQGTGCVHIAPGHGYEDYQVGIKYKLPIISPVDKLGRFTKEVPEFAGKQVFDADLHIIETLKKEGNLLYEGELIHSYPHCWRCHKPLIFRATQQWFLAVDHNDLRKKCLNEIDNINWIPSWSKERIRNMVLERPDWCLSRQKFWGVPIPVLYCKKCKYPILEQDVIKRAQAIIKKGGVEAWFSCDLQELVPDSKVCPQCGAKEFERETDVLDVWFDSSASYDAVLKENNDLKYPADLYLEATEQARGWFQLSLLESFITDEKAPYKSVVSHGLILDSSRRKMSKSLGNVISPQEMWEKYGADILRLQLSSVDYTQDFPFGEELFPPVIDSYRKIRNTFKFLLGNLSDFDPEKDKVKHEALLEIDKLILHRLQKLIKRVTIAYKEFAFYKVCYSFHNFCVVDLSKFYLDILKDRLYTYGRSSIERKSAQTVLYELASMLVRLIAPILPFTAEEVWRNLYSGKPARQMARLAGALAKRADGREESVHLSFMPEPNETWLDNKICTRWEKLNLVRDKVLLALEAARKSKFIGNPLEAKVVIWTENKGLMKLLNEYLPQLSSIFIVSQVSISKTNDMFNGEKISVKIQKAEGKKCERCWIFSSEVGKDARFPTLCQKCVGILKRGDYGEEKA
ncbi:isoleucine--tRNA ligase [candidate division WOR-3 bacterium]|nr:isoleucine--tRNA ligase [candidate division WOR-3 bacterium]